MTLRPEDVSWDELRQRAEGSWRLRGPDSQGGTRLYRYKGQLFVVGYGEYSSLPGGAEEVIGVRADNTPGFPPRMDGGHAAGCAHEPHFDWDWWQHGCLILKIHRRRVLLLADGAERWTCSIEEFLREDGTPQRDVLRRLGPAVLDEALRCAAARLKA